MAHTKLKGAMLHKFHETYTLELATLMVCMHHPHRTNAEKQGKRPRCIFEGMRWNGASGFRWFIFNYAPCKARQHMKYLNGKYVPHTQTHTQTSKAIHNWMGEPTPKLPPYTHYTTQSAQSPQLGNSIAFHAQCIFHTVFGILALQMGERGRCVGFKSGFQTVIEPKRARQALNSIRTWV